MNRYLEVLNESFDKVVIALNDKEGRAEVHVVDLVKQDENKLCFDVEEGSTLFDSLHEQGYVSLIGGDLKDVVVFGDDTNDKVMFDPQWTSVAMGNACQELKDIATIVTDANVDDGIYNICKKMEWI